jgi:adenosylcobinamide-GDP ribazoletransferase
MFSVAPVPGHKVPIADRRTSAAALRWLPLVGAALGAVAIVPALAFWRGGPVGSPLLGAVVCISALAVLTRGLHLDGLADLADGLGSRKPAEDALRIMRQSDIGPFGVAAVILALLLQITGLAAVLADLSRPQGVAVVAALAAGARLAPLWAAGRGVPAARPDGFGALVAGSARLRTQALLTLIVLSAAFGAFSAAGASLHSALWLCGALLAGQVCAAAVRVHAVRRLGGMSGDVFGALIEIAATVSILALAAVAVWRGAS